MTMDAIRTVGVLGAGTGSGCAEAVDTPKTRAITSHAARAPHANHNKSLFIPINQALCPRIRPYGSMSRRSVYTSLANPV